jgi:hypothetical protein
MTYFQQLTQKEVYEMYGPSGQIIELRGEVCGEVESKVWDQISNQVLAQVWHHLGDKAKNKIRNEDWDLARKKIQ